MSQTEKDFIFHGYGPEGPVTSMHLSLHGEYRMSQFRNILQRALNCAPPHEEQYKDWFALAELLEGRTEVKGVQHGA